MENENKGSGVSSFISAIIPLKVKLIILGGIIIFFLIILVPILILTMLTGSSETNNEKNSDTSSSEIGSTGTASNRKRRTFISYN